MEDVYITHIAACLPNEPVSNDDMESVLGQVGGRPSRARRIILRSNGIKQRYYAIDPVSGAQTHSNAGLTSQAIAALQDDEFALADIQTLACGTSLADQLMPGHGVMVHGELACPPCEVASLAGVCVAGVAAMKYAYLSVASGEADTAVSSGSELSSAAMRANKFEKELASTADELGRTPELAFDKDFLRWMLSDGAGAVVLKNRPRKTGLSLRVDWIFERSYANDLDACMYCGAEKQADGSLQGWMQFESQDWADQSVFAVKQDVKQLNSNIVEQTLLRPLRELIEKRGLVADKIDYFLPHYSSNYFRERVFEGLASIDFEVPYERWFTNLDHKGNTGSASIYIMLEEIYRSGKLQKGQTLLCYVPESGRFSAAFMHLTVC